MARKHGLGRGLDALIPQNRTSELRQEGSSGTVSEESKSLTGESPETVMGRSKRSDADPKSEALKITASGNPAESAETELPADKPSGIVSSSSGPLMIRTTKVEPDRTQPRKNFDEASLQELAESIRKYGIIEPLIVRQVDDHYVIVAGERRWRAAKLAGLREVPVVVGEYDDRTTAEIQLIENVQREDIDPIEEASAYQRLIEEFHLTQEEVAEAVSKSRTAITNTLRLLGLCEGVRKLLADSSNGFTAGHARALLSIEDPDLQEQTARRVVEGHLSVRETEKLVRELQHPRKTRKVPVDESMQVIYRDQERKLTGALGTKVSIVSRDTNKGKLEIEYYDNDTLDRIIGILLR